MSAANTPTKAALADAGWTKSSHSGGGNECVEVAVLDEPAAG